MEIKTLFFGLVVVLLMSTTVNAIDKSTECTCNSCDDCNAKLKNANCTFIKLTSDIEVTEKYGDCIFGSEYNGFKNKTFDCQGHIISSLNGGIGIELGWNRAKYNVIKNCTITGFNKGFFLHQASDNTIINNAIYSNDHGIDLFRGAKNNIIANNTIYSNKDYGITLDFYASNNEIRSNGIHSNGRTGIYLTYDSNNNLIENNYIKFNQMNGIYITDSGGNIITSNEVCYNNVAGKEYYDIFDESLNTIKSNKCILLKQNGNITQCSNKCDGFISTKWDVTRDTYPFKNFISQWYGGQCYSMSSTEILYFNHYILNDENMPFLPLYNDAKTTNELNLPANKYKTLNNPSLAIMMHMCYDPQNRWTWGLFPGNYNANNELKKVEENIKSGFPVIIHLGSGVLGQDNKHAVVVWGLIYHEDNKQFLISDPNYPSVIKIAYFDTKNNSFSYSSGGGYKYDKFSAVTPEIMQKDWFFNDWIIWLYKEYKNWDIKDYYLIASDADVKVISGCSLLRFGEKGNSQTFVIEKSPEYKGGVCDISGYAGISEGNIVVYAVPKKYGKPKISTDPDEPTFLLISDLEEDMQGYLINASSDGTYEYNVEITNNNTLYIEPVNSSIDLNVRVFHADGDNNSYLFDSDRIKIKEDETATLNVKDWGLLNSTTESSVRLDVYEKNSTILRYSNDLKNQRSVGEFPTLPIAVGAVILIIAAAVFLIKRKK